VRVIRRLLATACLCALAVTRLAGQQPARTAASNLLKVDSQEAHRAAVEDQRSFEEGRFDHLPVSRVDDPNTCTEQAGGVCFRWGEDSPWTPGPTAPEIASLRDTLLQRLDLLQQLAPGDDWILGQRVWYRGEAGDWSSAFAAARASPGATPWWREALEGLALHELGRYAEAEASFRTALQEMPPEQAERWRVPQDVVRGDVAGVLDHADAGGRDTLLARTWQLADPLYLVPGNDRETAHYARWTVATLKEDAANPHRSAWDSSRRDLVLRHGWERAWIRIRHPMHVFNTDDVVGFDEPEGREFMPPASAIEDPSSSAAEDLTPTGGHTWTFYTPPYAHAFLPMDGQLAVFPRGDSMVVIATAFVPADTTLSAREGRRWPWKEPSVGAGYPDAKGLFLMNPNGGEVSEAFKQGSGPAAFLVRAPAGRYVVSAEAWSPQRSIAGRRREGLRDDSLPRDVATLSDLLLVDASRPEPTSLESAADEALPRTEITSGSSVRLLWELGGLGWRPEVVTYDVTVDRAHQALLRRVGRFFHLGGDHESLSLRWSEPGPRKPGVVLRSLKLDLKELDPGTYRIRVETRLAGRGTMASEIMVQLLPR
jgi:hypothetical protein